MRHSDIFQYVVDVLSLQQEPPFSRLLPKLDQKLLQLMLQRGGSIRRLHNDGRQLELPMIGLESQRRNWTNRS